MRPAQGQNTEQTRVADTDGDGLSDGDENATYQSNPLLTDTDDDGFSDYEEQEIGSSLRTYIFLESLRINLSKRQF